MTGLEHGRSPNIEIREDVYEALFGQLGSICHEEEGRVPHVDV